MERRRLEQIDQLTEITRLAEARYRRCKSLGDSVLASNYLQVASALLSLKAELVRREDRQRKALEALAAEKVSV